MKANCFSTILVFALRPPVHPARLVAGINDQLRER
jgi:hypothetical protein